MSKRNNMVGLSHWDGIFSVILWSFSGRKDAGGGGQSLIDLKPLKTGKSFIDDRLKCFAI